MRWQDQYDLIEKAAMELGGFANDQFIQSNYYEHFRIKESSVPGEPFAKYRERLNADHQDGYCWALSYTFLKCKGDAATFFQAVTCENESYKIKDFQSALCMTALGLLSLDFTATSQQIMGKDLQFISNTPNVAQASFMSSVVQCSPQFAFVLYFRPRPGSGKSGHAIALIEAGFFIQVFEPNFGVFSFPKEGGRGSAIRNAMAFIEKIREIGHGGQLPYSGATVFDPIGQLPVFSRPLDVRDPAPRRQQIDFMNTFCSESKAQYFPRPIETPGYEYSADSIYRSDIVIPSDFAYCGYQLSLCYYFIVEQTELRNYSWHLHSAQVNFSYMNYIQGEFLNVGSFRQLNEVMQGVSKGRYQLEYVTLPFSQDEMVRDIRFFVPQILVSPERAFLISCCTGQGELLSPVLHFFSVVKKEDRLYVYQANTGAVMFSSMYQDGFSATLASFLYRLCKELFPGFHTSLFYRCHIFKKTTYQNLPLQGSSQ